MSDPTYEYTEGALPFEGNERVQTSHKFTALGADKTILPVVSTGH
jgi:hypothetical protein